MINSLKTLKVQVSEKKYLIFFSISGNIILKWFCFMEGIEGLLK